MCKYIYRIYILEVELLGQKAYGFVILKDISMLPSTAVVPTYTLIATYEYLSVFLFLFLFGI